jgi:fructose 1,6-bisphosphate aldolase/phosphatase
MVTMSIIKADTGGFVGHTAVHPEMLATAQDHLEKAKTGLLLDGQVR